MTLGQARGYVIRLAGASAATLAALILGSACSGKNTQQPGLVVIATTDLAFPKDYDVVDFKVTQAGTDGVFGNPTYDTPMAVTLPTTLTITPGSGSTTVRVVVRLSKNLNPTAIVETTAQAQVPTSGVEELDVFLGADCESVSCPLLDTCVHAKCTAFDMAWPVKPYDPNDVANPDATVTTPAPEGGSGDRTSPDVDAAAPVDAGDATPSDAKPADAKIADVVQPVEAEAAAPCGNPGEACCAYNVCVQSGCCDHGKCVAMGQTCTATVLGGSCTAGGCSNGSCGSPGQTCCRGSSGTSCTTPFTTCSATSANCGPCGQNGGACCPGNICQAGFACAPPPPGIDGGLSCVGCGGLHQVCCDTQTGVAGAPTTPCQGNYTCSTLNQCQ
jgi:hypothetical protein